MSDSTVDLPDQLLRSGAPLQPGDRADRTVGCRQSQPNCCGRHSLPSVCAFARADGICLAPPTSWKRQFAALSQQANRVP
jgi:hypothetical protein